MRYYYYILTICSIIAIRNGLSLYESLDPTRQTTQLFDRLKNYEIVTIEHSQFNYIEKENIPFYPANGILEFNAFGNYYKLLMDRNSQLFSDSFFIEIHKFNKESQLIEKERIQKMPQCHYTANVLSDLSGNSTEAALSLCHGSGIRGWIHSFGETIVIRPKLYLMDVTYKGQHKISDEHIVYKYRDLDRTSYDHSEFEPNVFDIDDNMNHRRRMGTQSDPVRYVELAIVNDPAMMTKYNSDIDALTDKTISIVATLQSFYLNTNWGATVGTIKIVLSAIYFVDSWNSTYAPYTIPSIYNCSSTIPSIYSSTPSNGYCEVSYAHYLNQFQNYRQYELDYADNAQLFSYYDFGSSVTGYAALSGMCISSLSGGIEQTTFDDEYNGLIVTWEIGHNFGMQLDSNGNSCDKSQYIMAAVGSPYGHRPDSFSNCSINYLQNFFDTYSSVLQCLDNKPSESVYSVCRNGMVEQDEGCDCGQTNCDTIDPCCDGSICQLHSSAECSNDDLCCENCMIKNSSSICRPLDVDNSCDIEAEFCDGASSQCPDDLKYIEGTECSYSDSFGYCYNGQCVSIKRQCELYGYTMANSTVCGWIPDWKMPDTSCDNNIKCQRISDGTCVTVSWPLPNDGIPCNLSNLLPTQCVNGECKYSSSIYTYSWRTSDWSECSIACKWEASDDAGNQTRNVECTLQNGTKVDDESLCTQNKPITVKFCNDYICTKNPTSHPTTLNPTGTPITPNPTTANPTGIPTTSNPTTSAPTISTTLYASTKLNGTMPGDDGIKVEIEKSSIFFIGLLIVGGVVVLILIYCILYIFVFSGMLKRTQQPGSATIFSTLKALGICSVIGLLLEIFDVITDYLYAVELITETNKSIIVLGWISLFSAIIGLILFGMKLLLTKKLIGYQETKLKRELQTISQNSDKAKEIMTQIRKRHVDLDTVSLLISCFEDAPQAMIVVIVINSNTPWNWISIANFSLAVISFLWKCMAVLASKLGCKDPTDVLRQQSRHKLELELSENTVNVTR